MDNNKQAIPEGFHDLGEDIAMKGKEHMEKVEEEADSHIHYPSLWFHNKNALRDLPKEGTAVIMYRKIMEREEKIMVNGKPEDRYTTELEICAIRPHGKGKNEETEETEKESMSDEDAIDKGLKAAAEQ
jgi:hypothetical protein